MLAFRLPPSPAFLNQEKNGGCRLYRFRSTYPPQKKCTCSCPPTCTCLFLKPWRLDIPFDALSHVRIFDQPPHCLHAAICRYTWRHSRPPLTLTKWYT